MYNHPYYGPHMNYYQQPQTGYDAREHDELYEDVYRPDDAEDAPPGPPPAQMPAMPSAFGAPAQGGNLRSQMCRCLGEWGVIGLKASGPFGRDFWFYPTEVRKNGVSGYIWVNGRRRKASYRYREIRNFACFG